jgi:hypothetical protein
MAVYDELSQELNEKENGNEVKPTKRLLKVPWKRWGTSLRMVVLPRLVEMKGEVTLFLAGSIVGAAITALVLQRRPSSLSGL